MNIKAEQIKSRLAETSQRLGKPLRIVETGTIRNTAPEYETGDGHSTIVFANYVKDNGGTFYTIDIETSVSEKYLSMVGLSGYVNIISGYSTTALNDFDLIDFAYLDSANDAKNTLDEFLIAWPKITNGGCVMVDDCNEKSVELHKGDLLMPYLRENGITYVEANNQIWIVK